MRCTPRHGFTLIELLVVVTIIVVLLALLVPGLERAVRAAEQAKCLANMKAVGTATGMYLTEYKRIFPTITTWNTLIGKNGSLNYYGEGNAYGTYADGHPRLLNIYMGYTSPRSEVPVASCPSDQGDSEPNHGAKENCYEQYGTSYLPAFGGTTNFFRVKSVFGVMGDPAQPSMNQRTISHTTNKVLMGEWFWHANRLWRYSKTRWHFQGDLPANEVTDNPTDVRRVNVLFADLRAELFDEIEVGEIEPQYVNVHTPPDKHWKWW